MNFESAARTNVNQLSIISNAVLSLKITSPEADLNDCNRRITAFKPSPSFTPLANAQLLSECGFLN